MRDGWYINQNDPVVGTYFADSEIINNFPAAEIQETGCSCRDCEIFIILCVTHLIESVGEVRQALETLKSYIFYNIQQKVSEWFHCFLFWEISLQEHPFFVRTFFVQ